MSFFGVDGFVWTPNFGLSRKGFGVSVPLLSLLWISALAPGLLFKAVTDYPVPQHSRGDLGKTSFLFISLGLCWGWVAAASSVPKVPLTLAPCTSLSSVLWTEFHAQVCFIAFVLLFLCLELPLLPHKLLLSVTVSSFSGIHPNPLSQKALPWPSTHHGSPEHPIHCLHSTDLNL